MPVMTWSVTISCLGEVWPIETNGSRLSGWPHLPPSGCGKRILSAEQRACPLILVDGVSVFLKFYGSFDTFVSFVLSQSMMELNIWSGISISDL